MRLQSQVHEVLDQLITMNVTTFSPLWQHPHRNPSFARTNFTIIRVLLNVEQFGIKLCADCDDIAIDSVEHKMFKCEAVNNERITYWNKIIAVCPVQLANEIEKITLKDRSVFILNGLGNCYIQE